MSFIGECATRFSYYRIFLSSIHHYASHKAIDRAKIQLISNRLYYLANRLFKIEKEEKEIAYIRDAVPRNDFYRHIYSAHSV